MPRQKKLANFWQKWQVAALFVPFVKKVLKDLTHEEARLLINKPKKAVDALRKMIRNFTIKHRYEDLLAEWETYYEKIFYHDYVLETNDVNVRDRGIEIKYLAEWSLIYDKVFGIKADFKDLIIPERPKGLYLLEVVHEGMTAETICDKCIEYFYVEFYDWVFKYEKNNTTMKMKKSARTVEKTYAVWVSNGTKPNEPEYINKLADDCNLVDINALTLEESLLLYIRSHFLTDEMFDRKNTTVCAGTRDLNGGIPCIQVMGKSDMHIDFRHFQKNESNPHSCTRHVVSN